MHRKSNMSHWAHLRRESLNNQAHLVVNIGWECQAGLMTSPLPKDQDQVQGPAKSYLCYPGFDDTNANRANFRGGNLGDEEAIAHSGETCSSTET